MSEISYDGIMCIQTLATESLLLNVEKRTENLYSIKNCGSYGEQNHQQSVNVTVVNLRMCAIHA